MSQGALFFPLSNGVVKIKRQNEIPKTDTDDLDTHKRNKVGGVFRENLSNVSSKLLSYF